MVFSPVAKSAVPQGIVPSGAHRAGSAPPTGSNETDGFGQDFSCDN